MTELSVIYITCPTFTTTYTELSVGQVMYIITYIISTRHSFLR